MHRAPTAPELHIVITGASRGVGRTAALALAQKGASLSLVVRDRARGEDVAREIRAVSGAGAVDVFVADLSLMSEVRRVAGEIAAAHPIIDVLVNNAGAIFGERGLTSEGLEQTFATNHVAYFLLTRLLLPTLEAAPRARVVVVASEAHRGARGVDWDDLRRERGYRGLPVYCESKLMNILFAAELARRLEGTRVTSNSLHPGTVASNFGLDSGGFWIKLFYRWFRMFLTDEAKGARTTVHVASAPEVAEVTGKYFASCKVRTPSRAARDAEAARRLWKLTSELTGLPED